MAWYLAKSLETLRKQVNAMAPNRGKGSDGTIGDSAHQATKSEHNANSKGAVRAIDITHDPAHGFDSWKFADMLRVRADPRIYYIISNGRIANPGKPWRKYSGKNKHDHHVHVSVDPDTESVYDNPKEWDISGDWNKFADAPPAPPPLPVLKQVSIGPAVTKLQTLLNMPTAERDGVFGKKTKEAVVAFQKKNNLVADGIVGHYTWVALNKGISK